MSDRFEDALKYFQKGNYLHAAQIYHSLLNDSEEKKRALIGLSEVYEKLSNNSSASRLMEEYISENPADSEIRMCLGKKFINEGLFEKAIEVLSVIGSEVPETRYLLGFSYYHLNDFTSAGINLRDFLQYSPNPELSFDANLLLSKIHLGSNEPDKALEHARKAEEFKVSSAELDFIFSVIFYLKSMYFHSSQHFEKYRKYEENKSRLCDWGGKIYYQLGDYQKAEDYFLRHLSQGEGDADTYSHLGMICLKTSRINEAEVYFRRALQIEPENILANTGIKVFN